MPIAPRKFVGVGIGLRTLFPVAERGVFRFFLCDALLKLFLGLREAHVRDDALTEIPQEEQSDGKDENGDYLK